MTSNPLIDNEFCPVLALVLSKGIEALENQRRGTHGDCAPEVISHMKALIMDARKFTDKLSSNKRDLEQQEKRISDELTEQRSSIMSEMERELGEAKTRLKSQKEIVAAQKEGDGSSPSSSGSSSALQQQQAKKKQQLSFTATLKDSGLSSSNSSSMPGDVDYWRAQAQDLNLVVEGRREALKSVQARIRSISHLNEHQSRAHGVIGLLRQAESAERQKAADYLRQAHSIREQAGLAGGNKQSGDNNQSRNSNDDGTNNNSSSNMNSREGPDGESSSSGTVAMLTEAETNGLENILNSLDPRLEVAKEAARLYAGRVEKLTKRLSDIETRKRHLSNVSTTLQSVTKYVGEVKNECSELLVKVPQPNLAILSILKKQHGEALQRLSRQAEQLVPLRLEVAELESQLRESRVNAIRSMHGTAEGTTQRIAQLRASKAAEVVQNQILGIENECSDLNSQIKIKSRN